jgi:radical SAM superfamily enzyme YgiQ (UPF0313 family)
MWIWTARRAKSTSEREAPSLDRVRVLLVSTYELGHQPLHVASPAAALLAAGHEVRAVDLAVDDWDPSIVDDVDAVALSVPMHTATRLAADVAASVRARRPDLPICAYGLYATQVDGVDAVVAGEYEPALVRWAGGEPIGEPVQLGRSAYRLPVRDILPPVDRYARLMVDGQAQLAAAVEASHGCASRCRHCPVPVVYDGRTRIVDVDVVVGDVARLVDAGVQHITFADPDFLNAVHHSMRVVRAVHERFPALTFDITTKVELIRRHRHLWPELAELGCLFVVSAFECVDDTVLAILDKGHTAAEAAEAVGILRAAGIHVRPSLLPFTPWTTIESFRRLVEFVADHDLAANVEPVHWTIRLLLPKGSLLLDRPELAPHLGDYDADLLGYRWTPADPATDELHRELAALVERAVADEEPPADVFRRVAHAAGVDLGSKTIDDGAGRPRLSEAWFCCAEPTSTQREVVLRL